MEQLFLKLLNMSILASWLVLAVIVLRLFFKKAPKWIRGVLWVLVAIRLLCPFSIESVLSLIPSAETIPRDIMLTNAPAIHSGLPFVNHMVNPVLSERLAPVAHDSVNPMQVLVSGAAVIWLIGMAAMLAYGAVSFLQVRRKVREALQSVYQTGSSKIDIWSCDRISMPFILGLFRPRIYLPSNIAERDMEYVVMHEKAHLKRKDHVWKPLGFLLLVPLPSAKSA